MLYYFGYLSSQHNKDVNFNPCNYGDYELKGKCYTQCPDNYFPNQDNKKCYACSDTCFNCFEEGKKACT